LKFQLLVLNFYLFLLIFIIRLCSLAEQIIRPRKRYKKAYGGLQSVSRLYYNCVLTSRVNITVKISSESNCENTMQHLFQNGV